MGGIEQVIHQIATGTAKQGLDVTVMSLAPNPVPAVIEQSGYRVHRFQQDAQVASTGLSSSALRYFGRLANEADVIHYHFPWPFMDLMHSAHRVKRPALVTYHSDIVRQALLAKLYRPMMMAFMHRMDRIVATSPNYFASSDVLNRFKEKVEVIPLGLDPSTYPAVDGIRIKHWQSRVGERFFLFVGVMRYYKGLHILLDAVQGSNWPIVLVGAGPVEEELREQAQALGLTQVHFVGALDDVDKVSLLQACTAVVFPSHLRAEAFGLSLLEGAMFGKPMVSSEIGTGTSFVNQANSTGLVVPPGDPNALRLALQRLWTEPELAREMGVRARQRFEEHFRADQMVDAYMKIYRSLAPRK